MKIRVEALVASLFAVAVTVAATAGVAALTVLDTGTDTAAVDGWLPRAGAGELSHLAERRAGTLAGAADRVVRAAVPPSRPAPTPTPAREIVGIGSNYPGTAGWRGQATVALPGDLGGRHTGHVNGYVTVCADRCARLPVVDWCQCYRGTDDQRVVDLSHPAWARISDAPLSTGLVEVRLILEP